MAGPKTFCCLREPPSTPPGPPSAPQAAPPQACNAGPEPPTCRRGPRGLELPGGVLQEPLPPPEGAGAKTTKKITTELSGQAAIKPLGNCGYHHRGTSSPSRPRSRSRPLQRREAAPTRQRTYEFSSKKSKITPLGVQETPPRPPPLTAPHGPAAHRPPGSSAPPRRASGLRRGARWEL